MATVDLVYFDAGGGHRAATDALATEIGRRGLGWHARPVQLMRVLDAGDAFRRLFGIAPEDVYNRRLARGWTLGMGAELRMLQAAIRLAHPALVRTLRRHWARTRPDLIVSLVPNFNRALFESASLECPGTPFVTVMTDFADVPPAFWIEPGQRQHLVCGTERAVAQALEAGYPRSRVHATSGMILRPEFHVSLPVDRAAGLRELGLDADRPVGLAMFGGHAPPSMLRIARALGDVQLICVCGRNERLRRTLAALRRRAPHAALGYVSDVPRLMRLADFFVGKPGPGSVSEALQCGLPVITFRNAWTMPQERYNATWLEHRGVGRAVASVRALPAAVDELLGDLEAARRRVRRIENRAVFEVVDLLATLLERDAPPLSVLRPTVPSP